MIQSLKVKNFLSFRDEVCINFEATNDKHLEDYLVVEVAPKVRLTKLGIVYGANASGKSNLLQAFEFLRDFIFTITRGKDEKIKVTPFLLDEVSRTQPTEFELTFFVGSRKFVYSLLVTQSAVLNESLKHYPGKKPAEIFRRKSINSLSQIIFNPVLQVSKAATDQVNLECLSNMSVFAAYNKVNVSIADLDLIFNWFSNQLLHMVAPDVILKNHVKKLIMDDESKKAYILNYLNAADYNINDINILVSERIVDQEDQPDEVTNVNLPSPEGIGVKKDRTIKFTRTLFMHRVFSVEGDERFFELSEALESKGTIRTMGLAGVINTVISQNAFLAIDEIESSLHPKLIEFVIESFLRESKTSQLLISTHYDGLLEQEDLFRNDTIWFTNKKKDGSTELYSLSDFNGINRINSLLKAYKFGKFGAIPNI